MFHQLLRCTYCHDSFEGLEEFSKCPNCGIGTLIGGYFAETGESAIFDKQDSTWNLELSFDDLDSHEYDLLGTDPLPDENGNIVHCYYTDMLERFTHTFVDSCFMPI